MAKRKTRLHMVTWSWLSAFWHSLSDNELHRYDPSSDVCIQWRPLIRLLRQILSRSTLLPWTSTGAEQRSRYSGLRSCQWYIVIFTLFHCFICRISWEPLSIFQNVLMKVFLTHRVLSELNIRSICYSAHILDDAGMGLRVEVIFPCVDGHLKMHFTSDISNSCSESVSWSIAVIRQ